MSRPGRRGGKCRLTSDIGQSQWWLCHRTAGSWPAWEVLGWTGSSGRLQIGAEWMAGSRHDGTHACIYQLDELGHRVMLAGCPAVVQPAEISALAFSRCGSKLATGDDNGVVILWDALTGGAEQRMQAGAKVVYSLSFSAAGARLASANGDGWIHVWDVANNSILATVSTPMIALWDVGAKCNRQVRSAIAVVRQMVESEIRNPKPGTRNSKPKTPRTASARHSMQNVALPRVQHHTCKSFGNSWLRC